MKKTYSLIAIGAMALGLGAQTAKDVTFKVDMNKYTGAAFTNVYVNGNYNAWCGSCNVLTDANKDGVWEGTFNIKADSIEFKYTLDGFKGEEALTPGTSCTKTTGGYTNRFLKMSANTVLSTVCYNSCSGCFTVIKKTVTFNVNMKQYTKTFSKVYVAGTFNSWSGNANEMTDADGDKIYSTTLDLINDSIEYKFELDNFAAEEKLTSGTSCTKTTGNFTNRFIKLTGNKVLGNVCWASCDPCATSGVQNFAAGSVNVYPNPNKGLININIELNQKDNVLLKVYNIQGAVVAEKNTLGTNIHEIIDITSQASGVYFLSITTSKGTYIKEFILNR